MLCFSSMCTIFSLLAVAPRKCKSALLHEWQSSGDDQADTQSLMEWLADAYHSPLRYDVNAWENVTLEMDRLAKEALLKPSLANAVGTALYSYFWWDVAGGQTINLAAASRSVELMRKSMEHYRCDDFALSSESFLGRRCHVRWRTLVMLAAELARYYAADVRDLRHAASIAMEAAKLFVHMRALPFFSQFKALGSELKSTHDMNFNADHYPHVTIGPVWPAELVPLASFLEAHYDDFKADLMNIIEAKTFWRLHTQSFVSETQFTPQDDDWQTFYLFLNQKFVDKNCDLAPRSCELLAQRPEIAGCNVSGTGAGFLRLRPGGRLKPHYGNSPRLSAHLGLIVPEAGDIHMDVGGKKVRWQEGRAVIFDDTYIHKVVHDGTEPRFIFHLWFCHLCDSEHWDNPPDKQPKSCQWPR